MNQYKRCYKLTDLKKQDRLEELGRNFIKRLPGPKQTVLTDVFVCISYCPSRYVQPHRDRPIESKECE